MLCIETKNLKKKYASTVAVDGVDLQIESGQVFGFLGPNGAGKSTVIKLLTTLISPSDGKISVLGIDSSKHPLEIRKKLESFYNNLAMNQLFQPKNHSKNMA